MGWHFLIQERTWGIEPAGVVVVALPRILAIFDEQVAAVPRKAFSVLSDMTLLPFLAQGFLLTVIHVFVTSHLALCP